MIKSSHLRQYIIEPTLRYLEPEIPYSEEAVKLLLMTAAHESLLGFYLHQEGGPALGIYQMEPATETDIWENFLKYKEGLEDLVIDLTADAYFRDRHSTGLIQNLAYATAMARIHYYRVPEPLPKTLEGLAQYAKDHFNTHLGKAKASDYLNAYRKLVEES